MAFEKHGPSEIALVAPAEGRMYYEWCRDNGYVIIGWLQGHDLTEWDYATVRRQFVARYPLGSIREWDQSEWTVKKHNYAIDVISDFLINVTKGRYVVLPNPGSSCLLLGKVIGDYEHRVDLEPFDNEYEHYRRVQWVGEVPVTELAAAKSLNWSDRRTLWWISAPGHIRDILDVAARHPLPGTSLADDIPLLPVDEADEFPEGRELYLTHKTRERNPKAVQAKKIAVKDKTGHLACEACGFDFEAAYGDLGHGYIECHHVTPIAEYEDGQVTTLDDLRLVCANCHRMLHRERPWMTVQELASRIEDVHA